MNSNKFADIIPYGDLGIIALESSKEIGRKVDSYISSWRTISENNEESIHFASYKKDSYLLDASCPRFGSGEAKGILNESVRARTYTSWWMYATTASLTSYAARSTGCRRTTTIRISNE